LRLPKVSAHDLPNGNFWADAFGKNERKYLILLARPKRFELLTPRFRSLVAWNFLNFTLLAGATSLQNAWTRPYPKPGEPLAWTVGSTRL
jgi:hypothetical protein